MVHALGFDADLRPAMAAVAQGDCASATAHLARLDAALAGRVGDRVRAETVLRARGRILVLSQALAQHTDYFNGGVRP
jgi:hypothetical protein